MTFASFYPIKLVNFDNFHEINEHQNQFLKEKNISFPKEIFFLNFEQYVASGS